MPHLSEMTSEVTIVLYDDKKPHSRSGSLKVTFSTSSYRHGFFLYITSGCQRETGEALYVASS